MVKASNKGCSVRAVGSGTGIIEESFQLKKNDCMEIQLQAWDSDPRKHFKQGEGQDMGGLWADLEAVLDPVVAGCHWLQTYLGA